LYEGGENKARTFAESAGVSGVRDYLVLAKFPLNLLVLATVAAGYVLGSLNGVPPSGGWRHVDWAGLLLTLLGAGLAAGGAGAWNQYAERAEDARMRRTRGRPLPAGRMRPGAAFGFGAASAAAGLVLLGCAVRPLAAGVAGVTLLLYVLVYTPLKKRSTLNTLAGAVCGALPPVLGWTAATGAAGDGAWTLFAILYVWQLPHLLAIQWCAREDFKRAGFRMLCLAEGEGGRLSAPLCVSFTLLLMPAGLLPVAAGLAGWAYGAAAVALGAALAGFAAGFLIARTRAAAWRLFVATIAYLPILLAILLVSRLG
jgi:protoheme IX farnesyltransferase